MSVTTNDIHFQQSKLEQSYGIRKIDDNNYSGLRPLKKMSSNARGVFGGNLCGQSLLVAMETVPANFTPHSLHSYFIKAGDDSQCCHFHIERVNDGKNFANRQVRVLQDNELRYIGMISFTSRNSMEKNLRQYHDNPKSSKQKPIEFQKSLPQDYIKYKHHDLPVNINDQSRTLHHKFPPSYFDPKLNHHEAKQAAGDRDLSFWIKVDDYKNLGSSAAAKKFKYAGFGVISDSLYLTSLSRILHLPSRGIGSTGGKGEHFLSVSLDHSIYFHDDDFDHSNWIFFNFKAPRFANNRVLIQGEYYNEKGKLFASIVQEGLVFFHSGHELKAKL